MKLRNIYLVCRDNIDDLQSLSAKDIVLNGRAGKRVSGWLATSQALSKIKEIEFLNEKVENLINSIPEFFIIRDQFDIFNEEWGRISTARNILVNRMQGIIELYEGMGLAEENKLGMDIKLPKFNDFSEYIRYISNLDFIFTKCPFLQAENESIQFANVDVGSTWLTFFVVGAASILTGSVLLNNFAAFVDKCIIIRSHYLTTKRQKQELETKEKDEKKREIISGYLDVLYKEEVESAIRELEKVTGYTVENSDGDEYGRIEKCFDLMGDLIDQGLRINASVDAPSEVQVLFQPLEMKYLSIGGAQKLLEEKERNE